MTNYYQFPLSTKVLAVAVVEHRPDCSMRDWTAYIDAVPGQDHSQEYMNVAKVGSKLPKEIAFIMFPNMPKELWRD